MAAVWFRFRTEFRHKWKGMLGIALLVGLAGGAVLTAFAGARRTASTLDRAVAATRASDVLVNPDETPPEGAIEKVAQLPQVAASSRVFGLAVLVVDENGELDFSTIDMLTAVDMDGELFRSIDRHRLLAGRYPRPTQPDEVIINERAAQDLDIRVGSRVRTLAYSVSQIDDENFDPANLPPPKLDRSVTVVGIAMPLDDAARAADDPLFSGMMIFTRAYADLLPGFTTEDYAFWAAFVRLTDGARDLPAFESAVTDLMGETPILFQERALTDARTTRAVRPYVFALLAFGGLAALAALAVLAQVLARSQRHLRDERLDLVALGYTRAQLAGLVALRALAIGAVGCALALSLAFVGSGMMPLGPLRRVEPERGMQLDAVVLLSGAAAILALMVVTCVVALLRRPARPSARVSATIGDELARAGASVPIVSGVRFALDRGRDGAVPLRSTLLGITIAIGALAATLVYGAGLNRFTSTPARFGWAWTLQVATFVDQEGVAEQLRARPDVAAVVGAKYSQFEINGQIVAAIGIERADGMPYLPLRSGRAPERDDEIVLGVKTMEAQEVEVGDRILVNAQGAERRFDVVGAAVFPRLAPYPGSEPTGLGIGAGTTMRALTSLDVGSEGVADTLFVQARPGATLTPRMIQREVLHDDPVAGYALGPQRPNDVQSYDKIDRTPLALVAILVLLALASIVHLLVAGVRSRRREIALLKTIGLTRAQATRSVLVQATTLILIALVVALPIGVLAGRWLWVLTARWLGIVDDASVPFFLLAAVVLVGLMLTNAIAYLPGRAAARVRPAIALRAE